MTLSVLKEKLHGYIDHADEKKVKAIYTLVESDIESSNYTYDDETLNMLEERVQEYQKSKAKGYTPEESIKYVKKELKKRGI